MEHLEEENIFEKRSTYRSQLALQHKEKKRKRNKILLLICLVLLLIGSIPIYFLLVKNEQPAGAYVTAEGDLPIVGGDIQKGTFTKGMSEEEIEAALQAVADKDNFRLQIIPEMVFEDSASKGSIVIVNPKSNVYPMAVEIALDDGTPIYSSGLIKPDEYIEQGKLLKKLPKGEYEAQAMVTIYSENGKTVQGVTSVSMNITINN